MSAGALAQLAILGLLVAAIPLCYVWVKADADRFRKLVWVTLFLTFDLILFGAFTRLTDSGLGCPDWPGCYGQSNPVAATAPISQAQAAAPSGPVTFTKAWIEMIHRYLAMGVGVLIMTLMAASWSARAAIRRSPWAATWLFALVCVQGAFGAWTVTMKLMPVIVTIHLLLGVLLLCALGALGARNPEAPIPERIAARLRAPALIVGTRDDATVPFYQSEDLHRGIPGSKLVIVDEGGHYSYRRHWQQWNGIVDGFLEERS